MSGKGSTRRPRFVPLAELAARWDATFGRREVCGNGFTMEQVNDSNVTPITVNGWPGVRITFPPSSDRDATP